MEVAAVSYAVVHMQKVNAGGIRGIQSHMNREHPPHSNPDIDPARTPDNYALVSSRNFYRDVQRIIRDQAPETKTVRKDAVLLCNFVVTSDHDFFAALPPDRQRAYFQDALDWFSARYGKKLIASAVVHMDETTPHMHLSLVPVKGGRLAAKNLFTKTELRELQTAFARDVGAKYGLERGVEGSERTHLSEMQFKAQKAQEQAAKASQRAARAVEAVQAAKDTLDVIEARTDALSRLRDDFSILQPVPQGKKQPFGNGRVYSQEDAQLISRQAAAGCQLPAVIKRADALKQEKQALLGIARAVSRGDLALAKQRVEQLPADLKAEVQQTSLDDLLRVVQQKAKDISVQSELMVTKNLEIER